MCLAQGPTTAPTCSPSVSSQALYHWAPSNMTIDVDWYVKNQTKQKKRHWLSAALICYYSWAAFIADNMDPDQTAPFGAVCSGFILFAIKKKNLVWSSLEYMQQTLKADSIFREKNYGGIRDNSKRMFDQ